MSTLKVIKADRFVTCSNARRLLKLEPGKFVWLDTQTRLVVYADNCDDSFRLRVEVNVAKNHFWTYLPPGMAVDLFYFAGLVVYVAATKLDVNDRPIELTLAFVDVTPRHTSRLHDLVVAA